MRRNRLHVAVLRAASLLAPRDQRAGWLREWRSELWYIPPEEAAAFCRGAFRDALWLRRNNPNPSGGPLFSLESPLLCITFLAAQAALCMALTAILPHGRRFASLWECAILVRGCIGIALLWAALVLFTRNRQPGNWASLSRRWLFLIFKIALLLPLVPFGMTVAMPIMNVPPTVLGLHVLWTLAFRWAVLDQRRRCPDCLRFLTHQVRIGSPSRTFLEWYGAESMCSCGHGLLHTSHYGKRAWLRLDGSWNNLFPEAMRRS